MTKYVYLFDFPLRGIRFIIQSLGSVPLPDKMLLIRIIENNKIEAYFRSG